MEFQGFPAPYSGGELYYIRLPLRILLLLYLKIELLSQKVVYFINAIRISRTLFKSGDFTKYKVLHSKCTKSINTKI